MQTYHLFLGAFRSFALSGLLALAPPSASAADPATAPARAAAVEMPARGLCAHRGAMQTHPENTLPALLEAVRLGAHMVEFDIQLTRDGALVLMHDATVDRTTDGKGNVADLTLAQIRALDAGAWKDAKFAGTRVPVFADVLNAMPRDIWLNCHLKGGAKAGKAAGEIILRSGRQHQAFLAAEKDAAAAARALSPDLLICNMERQADLERYVSETIAMKAAFIQLRGQGDLPATAIARLKAAGIRINYFQDETAEGLRRQFAAGIDFPLVNDLAKALPVAAASGIAPARAAAAP